MQTALSTQFSDAKRSAHINEITKTPQMHPQLALS